MAHGATYYRDCTPLGETVTLRAVFTDGCGKPIDADDNFPDVYLYSPTDLPDDMDAEVEGGFTNATGTVESASVVKLATGYYEITYDFASTDEAGSWTDVWHTEINEIETYTSFNVNVIEKGVVEAQDLSKNALIVILLDEDIADTDGNTLGEEIQLTFSTTYDPYYASPDLLRLECGNWLDGIPDDTLSLMIHWSSIEADAVTPTSISSGETSQNLLDVARTKFVIFDSAMRCLLLPTDVGGKSKRLGDLMISDDSSFTGVVEELKDSRDEWWRVLNARGSIVPGQGFAPTVAVKGRNTSDRRPGGRLWHSPVDVRYDQPTQNTKFSSGGKRMRFGYKKR